MEMQARRRTMAGTMNQPRNKATVSVCRIGTMNRQINLQNVRTVKTHWMKNGCTYFVHALHMVLRYAGQCFLCFVVTTIFLISNCFFLLLDCSLPFGILGWNGGGGSKNDDGKCCSVWRIIFNTLFSFKSERSEDSHNEQQVFQLQ